MREPFRAAAMAALLAAGCKDGCNGGEHANDASGDASGKEAADAGGDAAAHALIQALPGCHTTIAGGHAVKLGGPAAVSIAAMRGKALLTSTVVHNALSRATGNVQARAHAERLVLDATGAAASPPEPIAAGLPGEVSTHAAAVVLGNDLTVLTYAATPSAVARPAPSECNGVLAATSLAPGAAGRELAGHVCRPASMFRAAARGKLGIALAAVPSVASVEAWVLDDADTRAVTLEALSADGGVGTVDAPAVAAGTSALAAAYVVDRGQSARALHVARVGRRGDPAPKAEILDKDHVGTVSVAFENDTLHVVWSSFVPEKSRWVLRWSKWPAGGAPSAPQTIGTGVVSATMPSLAIDRGHFVLAWAEGDENATAVRVGASKQSLAAISGLSTIASATGVVARDPVVAIDGDAMFVAWTERALGLVRTAALKCLE
ncbi:MAG: hypothetical protein JWP87_811 [Labilithrix sp.]|nr:hypothetical protein [Labilithrix sp.]